MGIICVKFQRIPLSSLGHTVGIITGQTVKRSDMVIPIYTYTENKNMNIFQITVAFQMSLAKKKIWIFLSYQFYIYLFSHQNISKASFPSVFLSHRGRIQGGFNNKTSWTFSVSQTWNCGGLIQIFRNTHWKQEYPLHVTTQDRITLFPCFRHTAVIAANISCEITCKSDEKTICTNSLIPKILVKLWEIEL